MVFHIILPDRSTGACPVGTMPVYRVWDNRADTNHRYTISVLYAIKWCPPDGFPKVTATMPS